MEYKALFERFGYKELVKDSNPIEHCRLITSEQSKLQFEQYSIAKITNPTKISSIKAKLDSLSESTLPKHLFRISKTPDKQTVEVLLGKTSEMSTILKESCVEEFADEIYSKYLLETL